MRGFSERSRFSDEENALTRAVRAHAGPVISLVETNPTRVGLSLATGDLQAAFAKASFAAYEPEPFGLPAAREALARDFAARGFAVEPAHIMLTASTSESYGYLFRLLCNPGDAVLVPEPSYPLFDTLAQLEGVRLVPYTLSYDGEWHLSELRAEGAKAIIVVHPNNPTGHFVKRPELATLARLGLPILSDEVFAEFGFADDPERARSLLEAANQVPVFRLGGLSKSLALPQLKLAWTAIAGPEPYRAEAIHRLTHIADAYLSPNTAVQAALPHLLAHGPAVRERILARCQANLARLRHTLSGTAGSVLRVEGGWYGIVRVPETLDEESWALALLEDGVLVQPGYYYDLGRGAHLVLSLITPEPDFAAGIALLAARL